MFHVVLACATLLNLTLGTKLEMSTILPKAAEYCIEHPDGKLSVVYGPFAVKKKSDLMWQGSGFNEAKVDGESDAKDGRRIDE